MIVMKFGGSSVADAERIRKVADIVSSLLPSKPILVLSAMGDTTDFLLEAAQSALDGTVFMDSIEALHKKAVKDLSLPTALFDDELAPLLSDLRSLLVGISLIRELTPKTKDYLVSFGERLSVRIAAAYFRSAGIPSQALDAWEAGIHSNSSFGSADPAEDSWTSIPEKILPILDAGTLPIVTGFIAKDPSGSVTTLGRGGSDLTATLLGAALGAEEVQVWKDVDGILTADPRVVKDARPVEVVTYDEAAELAYFGAQVLHPRSMQPCLRTGTPVRVKNSYNPPAVGTLIMAERSGASALVRAITSKRNVTLIDIVSTRMLGQYGFLARVFQAFEERHVSVDMVATSEVSLSLTLDAAHDLALLKRDLERIAAVNVKKGKAIVTLIGEVSRSSEILEKAFGVCVKEGIQVQMVSQGASKVNISFIVDDREAPVAVRALHAAFFK